ncbi:MAG: pantetheine-phosphate adenylyltransferase [Hydrogenophaga sp.]|uniref:pantetheine-phosphate adenylyltransferase n=1 Tax=Hydrogenophaga sp. TaxID=1904254 RepID=UPI002727A4EC|nr:pantetheine-phosphate adenylyltransferase [Hydrogenophaga sp.]MDO9148546.1 pantetheine-phosphate adenylyltransferase [Hydrogenophaga sp.]MDO9605819.1 pantetheine-phosphate adenylyltransferase [Hydrogenophaga sp.]MDP2419345.1 pantetheine-phosphate adenylyltransferase [Hydrogenophaga sp.]
MSPDLSRSAASARIAVYSGTFDPLTLGHEDVARRASLLFDEVIIAVAMAHHKKTRFTLAERLDMTAEAAVRMPGRVRVLPFDGLIMDFCRQQNASAVVRGIRNLTDFDYEAQMAAMNRKLNPAVETVFLLPQAELQCISSTLVREISNLGGDVSHMVNAAVVQRLLPKRLEA